MMMAMFISDGYVGFDEDFLKPCSVWSATDPSHFFDRGSTAGSLMMLMLFLAAVFGVLGHKCDPTHGSSESVANLGK